MCKCGYDAVMRYTRVKTRQVVVVHVDVGQVSGKELVKSSESCINVQNVKVVGVNHTCDLYQTVAEGLKQMAHACVGEADDRSCVGELFLSFWEYVRVSQRLVKSETPFVACAKC